VKEIGFVCNKTSRLSVLANLVIYRNKLFINGVLFSHRKDDIVQFEGKWMQLEDIMLSEVSQVQKDKGCMFSLICRK
jgi:hypothetical protein